MADRHVNGRGRRSAASVDGIADVAVTVGEPERVPGEQHRGGQLCWYLHLASEEGSSSARSDIDMAQARARSRRTGCNMPPVAVRWRSATVGMSSASGPVISK